MAYNFVSPGAAASEMIQQLVQRRMAEARQRELDAAAREDRMAMREDRAANRSLQQAQLASLDEQRQNMAQDRRAAQAKAILPVLSAGQSLGKDTSALLKEGGLGDLMTPGTETYGVMPQAPEGQIQAEGPTLDTTPDTYRGTAEQIQTQQQRQDLETYLQSLDPASPEAKAINYKLRTGDQAPAGMFDKKASQSQDIQEYEYYTAQAKQLAPGKQPMSFEDWMKWSANLKATNGGEKSGYFIPVQTGNGIEVLDAHNGRYVEGLRRDLKPGEGAQDAITKAGSVLYQIGEIAREFSPDRVGVLKGRYKTMQLALVGEAGVAGLAEFQSQINTLKNTVINLRTGAQMSEPEAARILSEVPDFTNPPDVFMARLEHAKNYFTDWMQRRAKMAYGRQTTADIDKMVGGPMAPSPSHGATPAATPAPPKSRYQVSVR